MTREVIVREVRGGESHRMGEKGKGKGEGNEENRAYNLSIYSD